MPEADPAAPGEPPAWICIGAWTLDAEGDRLQRGVEVVKLEPRLTRLLLHLARHPGHVVPVAELLEAVWPDVVVTPESVYQAVAALRRALGDSGQSPTYIANVPRKGYRLIAEVRPGAPPPGNIAQASDKPLETPPSAGQTSLARAQADAGSPDDDPSADRQNRLVGDGMPELTTQVAATPAEDKARLPRRPAASWLARPFPLAALLTALVVTAIGTRVWLTRADVAVRAVDAAATSPVTQSARSPPATAVKTVLWVDDKPQNNVREREAMAAFGVEFELVQSTDEAVALLAAKRFDLVISDQRRPGDAMAGFTLLSRMRLDRGDRTPFVLYTSVCAPDEAMEARALGALACTTQISALMQAALAALEARP